MFIFVLPNATTMKKTMFLLVGTVFVLMTRCKKDAEIVVPDINFNPSIAYGSMTDQDGNIYKTVNIGTQVWMAENLRTTKYRNGLPIPEVSDATKWTGLSNGAYCKYDNDPVYVKVYGFLYNWLAVSDGKNIAPVGWHVPSDSEWLKLINYTGSEMFAGRNLKEAGTAHWTCPEYGGDDIYGFTALPGGWRESGGTVGFIGINGIFWTSSEKDVNDAWDRVIYSCYEDIPQDWAPKNYGFSVRCVKD